MTKEETKSLLMRKELNQKELDRLLEATEEFKYLLDSEQDILLKDVYYEQLLTQMEIDDLEFNKSDYSKELIEELKSYRDRLSNITSKNMHGFTLSLEKDEE